MPSPSDPRGASAQRLQHFALANGLKVYLREDHRASLVTAQLWYHVGASYEPPGRSGLSHLLEHLMFEGSSKLAPGQYSRLMTRLGGTSGAFTSDDATCFPVTLPASRLEIALEAMADSMASATLGASTFERELDVVKAERRTRVDNYPLGLAAERSKALAHGSSPYATPAIGHQRDLEGMTLMAVQDWYRTWYHPNNATLVVVGDIDVARLRPLVERHFASLPHTATPERTPPRASEGLTLRQQTVALPGLREGVILDFNTPSLATTAEPDHAHALRLVPQLLTEGSSARLNRLLVRDNSVLQGIRSSYQHLRRGDGLLTMYLFSNATTIKPAQAAQRVLDEVLTLGQVPPLAAELKRAKARLLASLSFARDDLHEQALAIGQYAISGLDPTLLDDERQAIEQVTPEQVRDVAQAYLSRGRLSITCMQGQENHHE
ncbi:pitrilysin family protein [Pseudomonas entomophila]|uniref:M16 family metallopeptidase n=1 Tax=Pseudomonas entomophila TaxID=312306 RepID=UPI0023D7D816|nr:pitrilysin family protein [Pseudomonas entomophila]MDF0734086.1 pitrilysin family protein [Pseudomonas entomophila]